MTKQYFADIMEELSKTFLSLDEKQFTKLLEDCEYTLRRGGRIIATGLGKNVPICEKFVGTMNSLGLNAQFMHTNTAMHGDLGAIRDGDLVLILTKSGSTVESVVLYQYIKDWDIEAWLLSFNEGGELGKCMQDKLLLELSHEGDDWDIVPNNSSSVYLILLQELAIYLSRRMGVTLSDFKRNHPGGAIGKKLQAEVS